MQHIPSLFPLSCWTTERLNPEFPSHQTLWWIWLQAGGKCSEWWQLEISTFIYKNTSLQQPDSYYAILSQNNIAVGLCSYRFVFLWITVLLSSHHSQHRPPVTTVVILSELVGSCRQSFISIKGAELAHDAQQISLQNKEGGNVLSSGFTSPVGTPRIWASAWGRATSSNNCLCEWVLKADRQARDLF